MARAIALLGEGANTHLAAELAGLDEPAAEEAIEALSRSDVLTRDRDRLGFVHPIVLAAIYNDLPVRARSEGHGRAARLLQARGATPEEVASQLALALPRGEEWAVETLRTAASRALSLGDPLAAAAHLRRALAEPPADRATVYSELASAEGRAGVPGAADSYREAMRLADGPRARGRAALGLARCLKLAGDSPAAIAVLKRALTELADADADLAEELQIEVISSAYISLVARPLVAAELGEISAPAVARTALDRLHLIARAVEGVIAGSRPTTAPSWRGAGSPGRRAPRRATSSSPARRPSCSASASTRPSGCTAGRSRTPAGSAPTPRSRRPPALARCSSTGSGG